MHGVELLCQVDLKFANDILCCRPNACLFFSVIGYNSTATVFCRQMHTGLSVLAAELANIVSRSSQTLVPPSMLNVGVLT